MQRRRQKGLVENGPKIGFVSYNYDIINLGNNLDRLGIV